MVESRFVGYDIEVTLWIVRGERGGGRVKEVSRFDSYDLLTLSSISRQFCSL